MGEGKKLVLTGGGPAGEHERRAMRVLRVEPDGDATNGSSCSAETDERSGSPSRAAARRSRSCEGRSRR